MNETLTQIAAPTTNPKINVEMTPKVMLSVPFPAQIVLESLCGSALLVGRPPPPMFTREKDVD